MREWDGTTAASTMEWRRHAVLTPDYGWCGKRGAALLLTDIWQWPEEVESCEPTTEEEVEAHFNKLADEWEEDVSNMSSLTAMIGHPKYREIVDMKWRVVPFLINDLQRNRRFWLPALEEITGVHPFDPSDSGNSKRMIDAWVRWGKYKYKTRIG
ncbi:MAG: hypothetical protein WCC37_09870 [Candidatus Sulfotelmatobacter sp.]